MDLKDVPIHSGSGNGETKPSGDKSCQNCNESWNMPPNSRDLKNGQVEAITLCLAKDCQQTLADGTYPRLAVLCRSDKSLCGGKLWEPVKPPMVARLDNNLLQFQRARPAPASVAVAKSVDDKKGNWRRKPSRGEDDVSREDRRPSKERRPYKVSR